jgi:hypothetical protein
LLPYAEHPLRLTHRPLLLEATSSEDIEEENAEGTPPGAIVKTPAYEAIRTRRWLWVEYADGARELYDMREDPHQLHSLDDDPEYAVVRAELAAQLNQLRDCKGGTSQVVPTSCGKERDPVPAPD